MRLSALSSVLFHACLVGGAWWWSGAGSARAPEMPRVVHVRLAAPGDLHMLDWSSDDASDFPDLAADQAAGQVSTEAGFDPRLARLAPDPSIAAAVVPPAEASPFEAPAPAKDGRALASSVCRAESIAREAERASFSMRVSTRRVPRSLPVSVALGTAGSAPVPATTTAGGETRAPRPRLDANPAPRYPGLARRRHLEGVAVVELSVDATGVVENCRLLLSSGHDLLDQCALRELRRWRFEPALENGEPIASAYRQEVEFRIVD